MYEVAVITSRAGTKNKGLWHLRGEPLVRRAIRTALRAETAVRVTSDQPEALRYAEELGAVPIQRLPEHADDYHQVDAVLHATQDCPENTIIYLVQPTSPFISAEDFRQTRHATQRLSYSSAQTVHITPHNYHAYNARTFGLATDFMFPEERKRCTVKQDKPQQFSFGNLVCVVRAELEAQRTFFAQPAYAIPIPRWKAWDVDTQDDLELAEQIAIWQDI